ncbi:hypothetical protein RB195_026456 [Necator americanus]|uniref:Uncharacterized protein n=1 Tax=Necator americanus TaxID=51031 RepID=A0ABR1EX47_NECAM
MGSLATTTRFVTLNCRTLSSELQQIALSRLLRYLCVLFAALQEARVRDCPIIRIENYTIYCNDADENKTGDWHIEEDPNVDYEILLRGLRACAERALKPRTTNLDRISKTTKELLEKRRALWLDPNASHIERNIPLAVLLSEDGTRTSSRREMEIITERFYSNRSSTPVSSPNILTGEAPPRILPSEVRVAIKSMKPGTASGPDLILYQQTLSGLVTIRFM